MISIKIILRVLILGTLITFGSLVVFTFSTTDVSEKDIIQEYKNITLTPGTSEGVMVHVAAKEVAQTQTEGKPVETSVVAGQETGYMNDSNPFIFHFPLKENPGKYVRSASVFKKNRRIATYGNKAKDHNGFDMNPHTRGDTSIPVVAAHHGKVTYSCNGCQAGTYGNWVEVTDERTGLRTRYAHLHSRSVEEGAVVKPGDQLGFVGNTGVGSGVHLHFEFLTDKLSPTIKLDANFANGKWHNPLAPEFKYERATGPDLGVWMQDSSVGENKDFNFNWTN